MEGKSSLRASATPSRAIKGLGIRRLGPPCPIGPLMHFWLQALWNLFVALVVILLLAALFVVLVVLVLSAAPFFTAS